MDKDICHVILLAVRKAFVIDVILVKMGGYVIPSMLTKVYRNIHPNREDNCIRQLCEWILKQSNY